MIYDLIIVGSGMVGGSLAAALQHSSLRIAVIEASDLLLEDPRLIALNDTSCSLFKNLGLWEALFPFAAPIQDVHISNKGRFGKVLIKAQEMGLASLGHVIPAKEINLALQKTLSVDLFQPAKVEGLAQEKDKVVLSINKAGEVFSLEAKWVIAADGTHSTVRDLLGIKTETIDYQQSAIVTVTELNRSHFNVAYERFMPDGVLAMLPLTEQRAATILTGDNSFIAELMFLNELDFLRYLQKNFGYRLGRFEKIGKRSVFPLKLIRAHESLVGRVLLIGNAAHTLHPVAAQGLNLALAEVAMLVKTILKHSDSLDDIEWKAYLDWQTKRQDTSITLSDRLPNLFSRDFFLLNLGRQIGMTVLDLLPALKKRFAEKVMGKDKLTGH